MAPMATILLQASEISKFESNAAFENLQEIPFTECTRKTFVEARRASEENKRRLFEKTDLQIMHM